MVRASNFHKTLVLLASFFAQFISEGIMISFTIYYPTLSRYFNASNSEISLMGSLAYGCWCCIGPFSGHMVDRYGSRPVLLFSGIVGSLTMVVSSFCVYLWQIIITFGILALCCGLSLIPATMVITYFFEKHRNFATTAATIGGATGSVVYPLLFQHLLIEETWQYCFIITSGLVLQMVVCGLILHIKPTREKKETISPLGSTRSVLLVDETTTTECVDELMTGTRFFKKRTINLLLYACHAFLWNLTGFGFLTVLPLYLDKIGCTVTQIAILMSSCALAVIVGRAVSALICAAKKGHEICCYNLSTLLTAFFILAFVLNTSFINYCILAAFYGLFLGVQTALMPVVTLEIVHNENVNRSFGIVIFACGAAGIVSPFLSAWLSDMLRRYDLVFFLLSLPSFLCIFLMTHSHWPFNRC